MTSNEYNQRCINLWGCIPVDKEWVLLSKLFESGNDFATGEVYPEELRRRQNLKDLFKTKGIVYE